jgi:hypothetical protein
MDIEESSRNRQLDTEIGEEPPAVSLGLILTNFMRRGIVDTLNDEALGPHTHLIFLLGIVLLIAIIIGVIQLVI